MRTIKELLILLKKGYNKGVHNFLCNVIYHQLIYSTLKGTSTITLEEADKLRDYIFDNIPSPNDPFCTEFEHIRDNISSGTISKTDKIWGVDEKDKRIAWLDYHIKLNSK